MLKDLLRRRPPVEFDDVALAERTRELFAFVEEQLGFEVVGVDRYDMGFTITYKHRRLGLALAIGADRRWGAGANAGRLDAQEHLRPFGRDAFDAGDWWSLARTVGAEPLNRQEPEAELERIAHLLDRRRNRLLRSARKGADGG